jgi:hypothetical protein
MTNAESLLIGIASSLVATVILLGLSELFRRVVLPWCADKIYRGVRIDGVWEYTNEVDGKKTYFCLELSQRGDVIGGACFFQFNDSKPVRYLLRGTLRDSYFAAIIHPISSHALDGGCFLFHVHNSCGMTMEGAVLAVSSKNGSVSSYSNILFKRKAA